MKNTTRNNCVIPLLCVLLSLLHAQAFSDKAACCKSDPDKSCENDEITSIIEKSRKAVKKLTSYQAKMEYLFIQDPELLDARTTRTGNMYYQKSDDDSNIRIHFEKIQRDDEDAAESRQEYLFDGVWLTRIDYSLEKVDKIQQAPQDQPIEAFTFIGRHFPLVGFSQAAPLGKDFTISHCNHNKEAKEDLLCLKLTPLKDSRYAKDYLKIRVWISAETFLPVRIEAESVNSDIYDISLINPATNKKLKNSIFTIETPDHFSKNVKPLQDRKD